VGYRSKPRAALKTGFIPVPFSHITTYAVVVIWAPSAPRLRHEAYSEPWEMSLTISYRGNLSESQISYPTSQYPLISKMNPMLRDWERSHVILSTQVGKIHSTITRPVPWHCCPILSFNSIQEYYIFFSFKFGLYFRNRIFWNVRQKFFRGYVKRQSGDECIPNDL